MLRNVTCYVTTMAKVKCPSCKREGTYSPKFEQCGACGLGYAESSAVTQPVTVTPNVTDGQSNVTHNVTGDAGRHCSSCTCGAPKTGAERQKAWRERKKS